MKVTTITGVEGIDNIKIFKPVSKVFIKTIYPGLAGVMNSDPLIRIRLVDGRNGSSDEIVPETRLSILSEIASKYEGFQRRAVTRGGIKQGFDLCSILIGAQVGEGVGEDCAAVDLSNDKYLDIDMRDMVSGCSYEIWGFENHVISPFVRTYRTFYLSAGELEKTFHVQENEILVYPMDDVKEIQFYAHNGASPTFRKDEFILDEDTRNDLVSVSLNQYNQCVLDTDNGNGTLPIKFGYSKWGVVDLTPYNRFDFRREDGNKALKFLMIDVVPTLPTVVANTAVSDVVE